ncbi:YceI family protein [Sulfitobacter aestuariivivens]|uniref:Polyisoprenoid-binding protein n=1 Tax=Sulfitobacter aestuariivivens TaxID=2766981 RepID=A0A927D0Q3_9RHOB|nr:YceI family protein [Sulfitobacter aestuariivivens]MBD3662915.1 polyisoprenoid-binding protein [Sulfitobacter aestuariivivens]
MKSIFFAAALTLGATGAMASDDTTNQASGNYVLDASHSQVVFSYDHLGFSTTYGMFSGFEGEITFDAENPAASSVNVSMPVMSMFTGWEQREGHFMSDDFFGAQEGDMITFTSTAIEVTGDDTAKITGDLSMNDVTKSVTLDATLNKAGDHPQAGKPWAGFDATTTLLRSDFDLGMFAPFVSDEVEVMISIEAMKAD